MGTVVFIVLGVLLLLAVGGAIAQRRRLNASEEQWHRMVQQADHDLAAALAGDRGWEYERLEAAARAAFVAAHPGAPVDELVIVEVIDRPGTEEDRAAFQVVSGGTPHRIELARAGDEWRAATFRPL